VAGRQRALYLLSKSQVARMRRRAHNRFLLLCYLFILLLFCVFLELHLSFIRARTARVEAREMHRIAMCFAGSSSSTKALQFLYLCISLAFRMWSSRRDLPKRMHSDGDFLLSCALLPRRSRCKLSRAALVSTFPPTFNCTLIVLLHLQPRSRERSCNLLMHTPQ
jgi:hypothetical protein